ncbi:MAG: N-acetyltransferase [Acidobacteriota bacterium]|jgi:RimJ/RimL family protein N-acetyltransferase|nr:N-acetyltransferase [Acidobacteriota bacterium]
MDIRPITLEGRHVRLEPLTLYHVAAFCEAGREWNLTEEKVRDGIETALRQQALGSTLPFATIEKSSGRTVGGTRFLNIVPEHRRLEIGSTWIAKPWRRTAINTEAKFLMLEHAFERLGCVRVEFMADAFNEISRQAILRLGAKEEGTFRNYIIRAEGEIHDAVFYSIIESEWPIVRTRLQGMLAQSYDRQA